MIKKKDYQWRDKFFFAVPSLFPLWPYPSRLAIGIKLDDFRARNAPFFNFRIKDKMYQISRERAFKIGSKFTLGGGSLPNLIPKECFKVIEEDLPEPVVWDFDSKTNLAYIRGTRAPVQPEQQSFL